MEDLKQGTRIEFDVDGVKGKGTIMGIQRLDPMSGSSTRGELKMDKYYIVQMDKPIDKVYEYDYRCLLIKEEYINLINEFELNNHGLKAWKHKTNKHLFLEQSYRWVDNLVLLDETDGRQVVDSFKASTFNYDAWEPMTQDEYDRIEKKYKEIYDVKPITKEAMGEEETNKIISTDDIINGSGLFNWNSSIKKDVKLKMIKWYNSLSLEEQEYVNDLRQEAVMDECDSQCDASL